MADFLDEIATHIPALRRYARALTRNVDAADDLVQDCLERAIRKRALWRPHGALRPWLFKILVNVHRNDRRRAVRAPRPAPDTAVVEAGAPPPQPDRLALAEVTRAIDALPAGQREALLLVALEGMSYADAARALGIPNGTLMSRLARARASLRQHTESQETPRLRTVK